MVRIAILLILITTFSIDSYTQNLVPNPSFEEHKRCPKTFTKYNKKLKLILNWEQSSRGTADYYNECSKKMSVPENAMGNKNAKSGLAYAGLIIYLSGTYREYLTSKLIDTLESNKKYCIKFYACVAELSKYTSDAIGIYVSQRRPGASINSLWLIDSLPQIENHQNNFLPNNEWREICGIYVAKGGERFVTIGNFKDDANTNIKRNRKMMGSIESYCYVDDVSVIQIDSDEECDCQTEEINDAIVSVDSVKILNQGDIVVLENINFEIDKSDLLNESFNELNKLVQTLIDFPNMAVEIRGHTDNTGNEEHNLELSEARTK